MSNFTPIAIFSDLLDGYSADRLATDISHVDHDKGVAIAQAGIDAMRKTNPTDADQNSALRALSWVFDGVSTSDLSQDHGIDDANADAYVAVIRTYKGD